MPLQTVRVDVVDWVVADECVEVWIVSGETDGVRAGPTPSDCVVVAGAQMDQAGIGIDQPAAEPERDEPRVRLVRDASPRVVGDRVRRGGR